MLGELVSQKVDLATFSGYKPRELAAEGLIQFINATATNIGRATFYNVQEDQRQALFAQHEAVFRVARPFYALMLLPASTTDFSKQIIAANLMTHSLQEQRGAGSNVMRWENRLLLQVFSTMPPNRVLDLFIDLAQRRKSNRRIHWLLEAYLQRHRDSLELWAIKYRPKLKRISRHLHLSARFHAALAYLIEGQVPESGLIKTYEEVRAGAREKLCQLPLSVARGFAPRFGLTQEEFVRQFEEKGQKTFQEQALQAREAQRAGVAQEQLDPNRLGLFELLRYLDNQPDLDEEQAQSWIKAAAQKQARRLGLQYAEVAVVLDNSLSMSGSADTRKHPLYKALAVSYVLEAVAQRCQQFRTNPTSGLIPPLFAQSNYAEPLLQALEAGFRTIFILGDGYENAPGSGALHKLLQRFKQSLDPQRELRVYHLNPVFAAESKDVRQLSPLVPAVGLASVEALPIALFLATARLDPAKAIDQHLRQLVALQNSECQKFFPFVQGPELLLTV